MTLPIIAAVFSVFALVLVIIHDVRRALHAHKLRKHLRQRIEATLGG